MCSCQNLKQTETPVHAENETQLPSSSQLYNLQLYNTVLPS